MTDKERRLLDCGANGKQPRGGGNECESAGGGMLELEERWKEWIKINWQILEQVDSTSTAGRALSHWIGPRCPAKMTRGTDAEGGNHQQNEDWQRWILVLQMGKQKREKGPPCLAILLGAVGPKGGKWAAMAPRADDEGRKEDSNRIGNWLPKRAAAF